MEEMVTSYGRAVLADSRSYMASSVESDSVDLIFTSPPFALLRKKDYGNVEEHKYVEWFEEFAQEFHRILKPSGSLVIDIGGSWIPGQPTRSLYHFELLIMLCRKIGFHLAQEFYWWNPSKLPSPAEWVNVRRIRVKDAVNCVFWLSKTPWPKASNTRVLVPYSDSMLDLFENGYKPNLRPSGWDISEKFSQNNGGAIPPNLLPIPNTESNSSYLRYCRSKGIKPHPARFPARLPEVFVRMLTDEGDLVLDPFAGSCVTGEVCERLQRRWICVELVEEYLEGARGRFEAPSDPGEEREYYRIYSPATKWRVQGPVREEPLAEDGGKKRRISRPYVAPPTAPSHRKTAPEEGNENVPENGYRPTKPDPLLQPRLLEPHSKKTGFAHEPDASSLTERD